MIHSQLLRDTLQKHLPWHGARLMFLALFLQALFKVRTVNLAEIATALNPLAMTSSNYRRLQRFFAEFDLDDDVIAKLILSWIPRPAEGYTLTLDRTNWQFGKLTINILVLGVAYQGVAIPVYWLFLAKKGNSHTCERVALMELFISVFGKQCIAHLTADREFIGKSWFSYLQTEGILFRIRIRHNSRIGPNKRNSQAVRTMFAHLAVGESLLLAHPQTMWGLKLYLLGCKLEKGEYLIIVSPDKPHHGLADYAQRWHIEVLFGILKSRGFQFEQTHLNQSDRLSKLLALLTLSTLWALKIGEWQHQQKPVAVKKHGRLAKSVFRSGLDFLRTILFDINLKFDLWLVALSFLSCT